MTKIWSFQVNINDLNNHNKPLFSLAEMCLKRNQIGRDLITAPAFSIKEEGRKYNKTIYLDNKGNEVKRSFLMEKYNLSGRQILNIFDRAEGDYKKAHKMMKKSSEKKKAKK